MDGASNYRKSTMKLLFLRYLKLTPRCSWQLLFWDQKADKTQADCRASARLVNGNTACDSVIQGVRSVKGGNAGDGGDGGKSGGCKHVIGRWPLSIAFKLIEGRRKYCYLTERDFLEIAKIYTHQEKPVINNCKYYFSPKYFFIADQQNSTLANIWRHTIIGCFRHRIHLITIESRK